MGPEDFAVAIDIGHSLEEPGAISARGVGEFLFNQALARTLSDELKLRGYRKTSIINERGAAISIADRVSRATAAGADLLISIHHDSVQEKFLSSWIHGGKQLRYCDIYRGHSIFYSERNIKASSSVRFALLIGTELRQKGFVPTLHHAENIRGERRPLVEENLGIYRFDDLKILYGIPTPAVLLEAGVIVNREEELRLSDPINRKIMTSCIANAVETFAKAAQQSPRP